MPSLRITTPLLFICVFFALLCDFTRAADAPAPTTPEQAQALVGGLQFQQGTISIRDDLARLQVPENMRFLKGHDAATVLVQIWGNPPSAEPLGMLVPSGYDLLADCWAVIISYEEDGYVKDDDAAKINYSELLTEMQKGIRAENKERQKQGYAPMELVGWATPPRYDAATHKLYWAKNLKFGGSGDADNTLNYNIRMLGRRGVLVLNAVAGMSQLPEIEAAAPTILDAIDFNPGNRYTDYSQSAGDKVAEYGIGALIAGGVAAKLGLFKGLWVLLLAGKKFVIIGIVALGAVVRKFFGREKD